MIDVLNFLKQRAAGDLLPWSAQQAAVERFGWSHAAVEETALANNLLPARYQRNRSMLSIGTQLRFFPRPVAVVRRGGLGRFIN